MKFMSTFLALSMLLFATAPAMARNHRNVYYANAYRYRNPGAAAALQAQREAQYRAKTQMEANLELQRQQMNSYYNNPYNSYYNSYYSNPYGYNPYTGSYYYGSRKGAVVNGVLNSIFR